MSKAIVIGAGWAGLSCAVELADQGYEVTVLEGSGRLGGRASSFTEKITGTCVDNGQHLLMGCYHSTLHFLKKIGSLEHLEAQKNLSVDFVNKDAEFFSLHCRDLPSPFHILSGLWGLKSLSLKEKISTFKVYSALKKTDSNGSNTQTVEEWLKSLGQSEKSLKYFWDPITLATLNEQSSIAEAESLKIVLREALFSTKEDSKIYISKVGLSDLCGPGSEKYLKERKGEIRLNTLVTKINTVGDSVRGVVLRDGTTLTADVYISALPYFILKNILQGDQSKTPFFHPLNQLKSSPIFSISIWFDGPITDKDFVGLVDGDIHWLFNKGKISGVPEEGYVSLVISGAHKYLEMSNEELLKLALENLRRSFPIVASRKILHSLIQREKNATLSPRVGSSQYRLPQKTPLKNFYLCGDWTDTGYPATIESAVLSGVKAAGYVV